MSLDVIKNICSGNIFMQMITYTDALCMRLAGVRRLDLKSIRLDLY